MTGGGELTLEEKAKELYLDGQSVRPAWENLGDVTKSIYLEWAADGVVPAGNAILPLPPGFEHLEGIEHVNEKGS